MNDIMFIILKAIISIAVIVITRYIVPFIIEKIGNENYARIEKEVTKYVLAVQQMYPELAGPERRVIVTQKIIDFLASKNIQLSEEQIRDLIESAVKTMKMQEGT